MRLNQMVNTARPYKAPKRRGRGVGSKLGKTCGRGQKGAGSRSGWKSRARYEGGQNPLYRKIPTRGFTRGRFAERLDVINLAQIDLLFADGDRVSIDTLRQKKFLKGESSGLKILGHGEISKKVTIEATAVSASAKEKLDAAGISCTLV